MLLNRRQDNLQFSVTLLATYRRHSMFIIFPIDLETGRTLLIVLENSAVIPKVTNSLKIMH